MQSITLRHILKIMQDAFNTLDERLIGHGNQVAYILWKLLEYRGGYTHSQLLELCALAVFHDIGAYKTEELNEIVKFEVARPHNHSIYGSLFIKYFSPLAEKSDIVLYHHLNYMNKDEIDSEYIDEALLFHLVDRITMMLKTNKSIDYKSLYSYAETKFSKDDIDLFVHVESLYKMTEKILENTYTEELYAFFETKILTYEELVAYLHMLAYSIDFRSEHTVYHTINVTELSRLICDLLEVDPKTTENVVLGALMHDIGKISTPVAILEKPGKLTYEEMKIMKNHVTITYEILKNIGLNEITAIASYHHEKLDGSGYPFGLKGDELSFPVRILIVTDILSALLGKRSYKEPFSKSYIITLLHDITAHGKIDGEIVEVIVNHYDELINQLTLNTQETLIQYENIKKEYELLTEQFEGYYKNISC